MVSMFHADQFCPLKPNKRDSFVKSFFSNSPLLLCADSVDVDMFQLTYCKR